MHARAEHALPRAASPPRAIFASLTPPALPRPPAWICAFTTHGRRRAPWPLRPPASGVVATLPAGTGMPYSAKNCLAWYSWKFMRALGRTGSRGGNERRCANRGAAGRTKAARRRLFWAKTCGEIKMTVRIVKLRANILSAPWPQRWHVRARARPGAQRHQPSLRHISATTAKPYLRGRDPDAGTRRPISISPGAAYSSICTAARDRLRRPRFSSVIA